MANTSHAFEPHCPGCGHEFSLADLAWMAKGDGAERWLWVSMPDGKIQVISFGDYNPKTMHAVESAD